ncbi:phosphoribosyltransferase domain-containing protein [Psychrobacter sp. AOP22-C1-22]|uniref:phosphoribosyltransferase domain-containing protein n=1 Tax=unclassified Psychrobacter TaxID=196806 RepID=UPI0017878D54|nr:MULTISPECIES: phosphoribosyltransferase domain-containing protein [unclassified Psychrobacter]MBE0405533.1 phosphoribosyltransferase domain-containing protein [Psychrobacter sp. FME6]MBE0445565.1 phosphoribosyltransferase domain-containing protein [Psychrobacter sp. FME5]
MPNKQYSTTITLPRGTLDLTYQTNTVTDSSNSEKSNSYELEDLLDFAQRINPKRAFLFVSKILGRHIPVAPKTMRSAFTDLANLVPNHLPEPILVIGMAETAVGLSAGVHQALQTRYPQALLLNSTRHAQHKGLDTDAIFTTFSEDHSHASQHLIYKSKDESVQKQLLASKTLIMVDDEASTGNTCVNVVTALRNAGIEHLEQAHLTTLVDWSLDKNQNPNQGSSDADDTIAKRLPNIDFHRHHLLSGAWTWTDAPNPEPIIMPSVDTTEAGSQVLMNTGNWGRFPTLDSTDGFDNYLLSFQSAFAEFSKQTQFDKEQLPQRILVLGSNEFVWLPFLLAEWLEQNTNVEHSSHTVKFSALTRSPIALGGGITTMLSFNDNYGLGMTNFAYNVELSEWDLIVLCVETAADSVDKLWQDLDNVLVVSPTL